MQEHGRYHNEKSKLIFDLDAWRIGEMTRHRENENGKRNEMKQKNFPFKHTREWWLESQRTNEKFVASCKLVITVRLEVFLALEFLHWWIRLHWISQLLTVNVDSVLRFGVGKFLSIYYSFLSTSTAHAYFMIIIIQCNNNVSSMNEREEKAKSNSKARGIRRLNEKITRIKEWRNE